MWPIALLPISATPQEIRQAVAADALKSAMVFVRHSSGPVERIKALASPFIAHHLTNLFLSAVRLAKRLDDAGPDEVGIGWVMFNFQGRFPDPWQGLADRIVPKELPVTVSRLEMAGLLST